MLKNLLIKCAQFLTLIDNIGYEQLVHDTFCRNFSFIKKDLSFFIYVYVCVCVCVCVCLHVCGCWRRQEEVTETFVTRVTGSCVCYKRSNLIKRSTPHAMEIYLAREFRLGSSGKVHSSVPQEVRTSL